MGATEILTLLFVVLKLTGVIAWSWWCVLLPEIAAAMFYTMIIISAVIVTGKE